MREFQDDSERLDTYLQALAQKLNSNEEFSPDDTFTMETSFIRTPGPGGKNSKKYTPAYEAIRKLIARKTSIVTINNDDQLCCACAIVTMKAYLDEGHDGLNYKNLRKGRPIQGKMAKELHQKANVPEGPCGLKGLQQFQDALPGYQIKVLAVYKPHQIIFCGPEAPKKICLIKFQDHYHGCNSFSGFLNRSYFCHDCNCGYEHENRSKHPCKGKWCWACEWNDCKGFKEAKASSLPGQFPKPHKVCASCNRLFFGQPCYDSHKIGTKQNKPLCDLKKKCLQCRSVYEAATLEKNPKGVRPKNKYKHKCGWGECPICLQQVEQNKHQCFIQPIDPNEDEPQLKKVKESEIGNRKAYVGQDGSLWVEKSPPLFVYADYEAVTNDSGVQSPILVCCESEDGHEPPPFYGTSCTEDFFDYLDGLKVDEYNDERRVIVIFHNFKGYDAMFVLQYLYANCREVSAQICIGTKVLSLKSGNLTFKDSLWKETRICR